jgi:hypothetical protein
MTQPQTQCNHGFQQSGGDTLSRTAIFVAPYNNKNNNNIYFAGNGQG